MTNSEKIPVYAVHAVRPEEITATNVIFRQPDAAERYAQSLSTDPGVLAAAITRYVLDTDGHRTPYALYVAGKRQAVPHISDDRKIHANAHGDLSAYALAAKERRRERQ